VERNANHLKAIAAFTVALAALGSTVFLNDPTPLLIEPTPDLDWPLGLLGLVAGLWAAIQITRLPYTPRHNFGRVSLWIILPLFLGFGLPAVADRAHEALSFRAGSSMEAATAVVREKRIDRTKSGRVIYKVTLNVPTGGNDIDLEIDQTTFERIEPQRECVTIAVERASDGAARLLRPLRWKVRCPQNGK
jgi:hypothetical protein